MLCNCLMRFTITLDRYKRLCKMVNFLAGRAFNREALSRKLRTDVRGFYRDLLVIRQAGVVITLDHGQYALGEERGTALVKLPFPDPQLTLGEARTLAQGSSPAH